MNQPPTIPEGDEENEGVEQVGEGTRFPHKSTSQQVPPMHDAVTTPSDLQPREDSGVGYGQTPTLQNEIIAVSGDEPTHSDQQAEYQQPSSVEGTETDDQAKIEGEPTGEQDVQGELDESGMLQGIREDETPVDESALVLGTDRSLPTLVESPIPPVEEAAVTSPRGTPSHDHLKPEEAITVC